MCIIEDILFEAHREGLREQVLKTLDTIQQMHSHMEMRDKVELAYRHVKTNNNENNIYNMPTNNNIY
jgi:hypothetical protein